MSIKSNVLIESKSLRESVIDRLDVLEKVKRLDLLPDGIHLTIKMVAAFYEVSDDSIQKVAARKKEELESDGMKTIRGKALKDIKSVCGFSPNIVHLTLFTRRSLLRVGMLLEESDVAQAVRDRLLDIEEKKNPGVSDTSSLSPLLQVLINIETRQNALEDKVKEIDEVRNAIYTMTDSITLAPDSTVVTRTINELCRWTRLEHEEIYNRAYDVFKQKHGIDIPRRVANERQRLQDERIGKKGKPYAESTLKSKVNGLDIMVHADCLDLFHEILVAWLTKEKAKSKLRIVQ